MSRMKFSLVIVTSLLVIVTTIIQSRSFADEGMFPISEIAKLDLKSKGLKLTPAEVFSADSVSLADGICRVNGCTGSFVSDQGLIITNHHCAYRAIQSASSTSNDYLKDGFQAKNLGEEIPATGYTVRVTESLTDVSKQVLEVVEDSMSFGERTKAIDRRRAELEKKAEKISPGIRAEVAEMFAGKTYVLFRYTYIKDVRLVFAPPSSIGNFGGDVDNWEWPRHTGDFSFMRAYVAKDGSTADYSADNVPYQPKRFIQVQAKGANEGDYVMLLGYPGRTARHKTASFLEYEQEFRLPYVVENYGRQIATMDAAGENDRAVALKLTSRSKGLANVEKRSRGQLKGLNRAGIIEKRAAVEAELQAFIDKDPERKKKYGNTLKEIDSVYAEIRKTAKADSDFLNLRSACQMLRFAFTAYDASIERQKPDLERESAYMDRNYDQTKQRMMLSLKDIDAPTDKLMLRNALSQMTGNPSDSFVGLVDRLYAGSSLNSPESLEQALSQTPDQLRQSGDTFMKWAVSLHPRYMSLREKAKQHQGQLGQLYGDLVTVKQEFQKTSFVPDANATLRLTHGTVRGYSPEDAVVKSPATTLSGVVAKTTGVEPFVSPKRVLDLHEQKKFGNYSHPELDDVPVAILYDTDTTGGNSGSPILNGDGELVGVNFDRAFEATINDFAWNTDYSRSIGVDIRYVLWVTDIVYEAKHLIEEMGVEAGGE